MYNYKVTISYDGTEYHGFAKQSIPGTVAEVLEETLSQILKEPIKIYGSGRTDRGVHALGQVINFFSNVKITEIGLEKALNSNLPKDIVAKKVETVDNSFNARFSAKEKTYIYVISKKLSPFTVKYMSYCKYKLDIAKMKSAIKLFVGEHDFKSYMSTGSAVRDTVRTIYSANINEDDEKIVIEFTGEGFLYNQVRIMVGTLIEIGRGKIDEGTILQSFDEYTREKLGTTAEPQGLYLKNVKY